MSAASTSTSAGASPRARGFTLIELLIVISIISLLAVALLPGILDADNAAKETATKATMVQLKNGCETFQRKHGYYPPDDLKSPEAGGPGGWTADNGTNTGIESLVVFLSQSKQDGIDLGELADHITNTDKDQHGMDLPLLHRRDRPEIADSWGRPFAYFGKFGMDKTQQVGMPEDETLPAKAMKRDDGTYFGAGKFQLLSAGKDGIFNTTDDLCWPEN
jgi:prepilin-type N-terminal cleavage/methylation domain-containing protein